MFFRARRSSQEGSRGEVFFGASRRVRGREARRGLQPGDVQSSLRRAPAGEGAEARRPAGPQPGVVVIFSSVRVGVGEGLVACGSINFGRPGALLGSSVAFGSGCGQALSGVPLKAPLCS